MAIVVVAVITLEGVAGGTAFACAKYAAPVVLPVGIAVFGGILDGVEGAAHFFRFFTEEGRLEDSAIIACDVSAVGRTNDGVTGDIALEANQFVTGCRGFARIQQPFVIDVAQDAFLAEIDTGFNEVTQANARCRTGKSVRQVATAATVVTVVNAVHQRMAVINRCLVARQRRHLLDGGRIGTAVEVVIDGVIVTLVGKRTADEAIGITVLTGIQIQIGRDATVLDMFQRAGNCADAVLGNFIFIPFFIGRSKTSNAAKAIECDRF